MKSKLVSILIVSYNSEKFIAETIKSCLNQDYKKIELVILDNNSQDNTVEIINSFKDSRIRLYKSNENLGPYKGLNFLLNKIQGEFIAIQDHDDIWFPEKIKKQLNFLNNHKGFIACGTNVFYFFEERKKLIIKKFPEEVNYVNHTSLLFKNKDLRYDTKHIFPEEHFEKKKLAERGKIGCVQEGLTIHRIRGDGNNHSRERFNVSYNNIKSLFEINGFNLATFKYLTYLTLIKYIPSKIIWFYRENFTFRGQKKWDEKEFVAKFNLKI